MSLMLAGSLEVLHLITVLLLAKTSQGAPGCREKYDLYSKICVSASA